MRLVVKVGSNVLTRKDGMLDVARMSSLVGQMACVMGMGHEVILVSSGAVACGRSLIKTDVKLDEVEQRQLFSAVGQVSLMSPKGTRRTSCREHWPALMSLSRLIQRRSGRATAGLTGSSSSVSETNLCSVVCSRIGRPTLDIWTVRSIAWTSSCGVLQHRRRKMPSRVLR